jgi:uncharacterized protein (TIGR02001 family)
MKKNLLLIAVLSAAALLRAEDASRSSYQISVDFPYVSKYVFRGVEHAKDSIQPSVEFKTGDIYAMLWTNQPVAQHSGKEFDFQTGYKYRLNDAWDVDLGGFLYYLPQRTVFFDNHETTVEGYLGVNGDLRGIKPGLYVYNDFTLNRTTALGKIGYSVPLTGLGTQLDLTASIGRVFPRHDPIYTYTSVDVNLPYNLNQNATVYVGVNYANNNLQGVKGDLVSYTAGIVVGF